MKAGAMKAGMTMAKTSKQTMGSGSNGTTHVHAAKALACAASIAAVLLGGCRVGPKYVKATAPAPPEFKESAPAAYANAPSGTWQPAKPEDAAIKGKWWEVFNEPELNTLEEQLDINNQNIKQYFQNFMAARAQVREARSQFFPTLTADPSFTRQRSPSTLRDAAVTSTTGTGGTGTGTGTGTTTATGVASTAGTTISDIALPFDVSWEPDLWGKIRNTVREYQYASQVSAADLENERLTEQADLAEYYFELRGQDSLQDLYNKTVEADQKSLDLTRALYETGIDNDESVAQAEITLQNAQETQTGIATNRAIYEHAIATLIGKPASDFSVPVKPLTTPVPSIPVGVPSKLLERRPDIAAAERTMAEANALIGVETAAYYPTLSLTGSGGLESSAISSLFTAPALFWSAGSAASETIFDAGLRKATVAQYTASYNADVAAYRQTVLTAFQQTEDYIATLRVTSQEIHQQEQAVKSAQRYVDIATARYQTGLDPYLNVISAQTTLLGDQQTQVTLRVNEMTAAVQLVQALGGGWDASQLPAAAKINTTAAQKQVADTP
jgi:NodT family efflux transporter outer membrane factor (OMF) lipoprotein